MYTLSSLQFHNHISFIFQLVSLLITLFTFSSITNGIVFAGGGGYIHLMLVGLFIRMVVFAVLNLGEGLGVSTLKQENVPVSFFV